MNGKKTALVTGGSGGIGRAICLRLARDGYYVFVNFNSRQQQAEKTLEMITRSGNDGELCRFDITKRDETGSAIARIIAASGRIDVLINNAGITNDQVFVMMSPANWDSVIKTSLEGFYNVTKPVLENMVVRKSGRVVSIASVAALTGNKGQANYSAGQSRLNRCQ